MVTIINYKQRTTANGETFYSLILQGQLEMIQSEETGNFYATARKTSITSTLNEAACKSMIGQSVPGEIIKVECEPYEYTVAETGEVIELTYQYKYVKEDEKVEATVA